MKILTRLDAALRGNDLAAARWFRAQGPVSEVGVDVAGDPVVVFESGRSMVLKKLAQRVVKASSGQTFVTEPTRHAEAELLGRKGKVELVLDLQQTSKREVSYAADNPDE